LSLLRQQRLFQERRVKPGDRFSYKSFEPSVNLVVRTDVVVKDYETVMLPGGKKKRMLRVEARPEKIEKVQLPTLTAWLGEDLTPVLQQVQLPGLGPVTLHRSTRDAAAGPLATGPDIGLDQMVKLNKRLPRGYATSEAVYRVTLDKDVDEPAAAFPSDGAAAGQGDRGPDGGSHPPRQPGAGSGRPGGESRGRVYAEFLLYQL